MMSAASYEHTLQIAFLLIQWGVPPPRSAGELIPSPIWIFAGQVLLHARDEGARCGGSPRTARRGDRIGSGRCAETREAGLSHPHGQARQRRRDYAPSAE